MLLSTFATALDQAWYCRCFFFPRFRLKKASEHQASMENLYLEIELTSRKYEKLGMVRLETVPPPQKKARESVVNISIPIFHQTSTFGVFIFVGV